MTRGSMSIKNLKFEIDGIGISVDIPSVEKVKLDKGAYRKIKKGDLVEFETICTNEIHIRVVSSVVSAKIVDGFYIRASYDFINNKFHFMEDAEQVVINFEDGSCIQSDYIKSIKVINSWAENHD